MVVFDPRRTETAKVATEHHFVRPGTDALVLLAMLHVLFDEGLTRPPSYVDGAGRRRRRRRRLHPGARPRRPAASPPTTIRRLTREFAAADGAAAYGRIGVSTQGFGTLCQWAIQCLNLLTGNLDRAGGVLFPEPAVDAVGRRTDRPRALRRVAQPGARPAGVRRRAAGVGAARGDRDAGRGPDPGDAHARRQPGALHPGRRAARRGAATASTSWRPSTSTSTRPPGTPT